MSDLSVPQDERSHSGLAAGECFAGRYKSAHSDLGDLRAALDAFFAFGKH